MYCIREIWLFDENNESRDSLEVLVIAIARSTRIGQLAFVLPIAYYVVKHTAHTVDISKQLFS